METIGFIQNGSLLRFVPRRECHTSSDRITMAAPKLSRRKLGQLTLGTTAAFIAGFSTTQESFAASQSERPNYIKDDSGIRYYDVKSGTGSEPVDGDFVVVDYLAFLSNGKVFDNRKGFVFQMGRRQVIPGLENAIQSMKAGGERKVVIPPSLAYGDKGVCLNGQNKECLVPPGETLGYSVTLQRVAIPPT